VKVEEGMRTLVRLLVSANLHHWRRLSLSKRPYNRLGGVIVSVLAIVPKDREFKPLQGEGFLRTIKIRSKPFSEGK
jgi:hypothetical protein